MKLNLKNKARQFDSVFFRNNRSFFRAILFKIARKHRTTIDRVKKACVYNIISGDETIAIDFMYLLSLSMILRDDFYLNQSKINIIKEYYQTRLYKILIENKYIDSLDVFEHIPTMHFKKTNISSNFISFVKAYSQKN